VAAACKKKMKGSSLHTHQPHHSFLPVPRRIIVLSDMYIIKNCKLLHITVVYRKTGTILWQEGATGGEWACRHQPSQIRPMLLNWHAVVEKDIYEHQLPDIDIKIKINLAIKALCVGFTKV